jgi:hypothetical protein
MTLAGGKPYSYREDLGQKTFSAGWKLDDAFAAVKAEYPQAVVYQIGEATGDGGCVTGWERDAMPGA